MGIPMGAVEFGLAGLPDLDKMPSVRLSRRHSPELSPSATGGWRCIWPRQRRSVVDRGYATLRRSSLLGAAFGFIGTALWSTPARADEWWGRDKALHFTLSIGLSSASYAVSAPFTDRRELRVLTAAGASLAMGASKEAYDAVSHGDPSWRDFAWDVAGTAVGVLIAYAVDCIVSAPEDRPKVETARSPITIPF